MALELPPGTIFDQFRIIREIGRGGMGAVFEVDQQGRRFALKLLSHNDPSSTQRFLREAQLLARVDRHPNIVSIHAFGQSQLGPWFTMDYIQGQSLADLLDEQGPLSPAETKKIATDIASALEFIHSQGISHRDLKAENVLISNDGRVYLADFGIARATDNETLTKTGQALGTPHAMAPELLCGEPSGPPADLWALGVLLYQCLTAELPFQADSMTELAIAIVNRKPKKLPRHIPSDFQSLLNSLLSTKPNARPDSQDTLIAIQNLRLHHSRSILPLALIPIILIGLISIPLLLSTKNQKNTPRTSKELFEQSRRLEAQARKILDESLLEWIASQLQTLESPKPSPEPRHFISDLQDFQQLYDRISPNFRWPDPNDSYATRALAIILNIQPALQPAISSRFEQLLATLRDRNLQAATEIAMHLQLDQVTLNKFSQLEQGLEIIILLADLDSNDVRTLVSALARLPDPLPDWFPELRRRRDQALVRSLLLAISNGPEVSFDIRGAWLNFLESPATIGPEAAPIWASLNSAFEKILRETSPQRQFDLLRRWLSLEPRSHRLRWPITSDSTAMSLAELFRLQGLNSNDPTKVKSQFYEMALCVISAPPFDHQRPINRDAILSIRKREFNELSDTKSNIYTMNTEELYKISCGLITNGAHFTRDTTFAQFTRMELPQRLLQLTPPPCSLDRFPHLYSFCFSTPALFKGDAHFTDEDLRASFEERIRLMDEAFEFMSHGPPGFYDELRSNLQRRRIEFLIFWTRLPDNIPRHPKTLSRLDTPPLLPSQLQQRLLDLFPIPQKSLLSLRDWARSQLDGDEPEFSAGNLRRPRTRVELDLIFASLLSGTELQEHLRDSSDHAAKITDHLIDRLTRRSAGENFVGEAETEEYALLGISSCLCELYLDLGARQQVLDLCQRCRKTFEMRSLQHTNQSPYFSFETALAPSQEQAQESLTRWRNWLDSIPESRRPATWEQSWKTANSSFSK